MEEVDSRQWSEWMAFDRIEPPDLWASTTARLIYALVCSWSGGTPPTWKSFLPRSMTSGPVEPMDERQFLAAFGIKA